MTVNKVIAKLLKLKGLKVADVSFRSRDRAIHLSVKPHKNGCRCP